MLKAIAVFSLCALSAAFRLPVAPGADTCMSRRAVVGAAVWAAAGWSQRVGAEEDLMSDLIDDEEKLKDEKVSISAIDSLIQDLRARIFKDELQEKKDEDASLEALKKGDKATAKKLADEKALLASDEAKKKQEMKELMAKESEEVAAERALEAKIVQEKKAVDTME